MESKYPKYLKDCEYCKKPIIAQNCWFDKPKRKYCSRSCSTSVRNTKRIWTESQRKNVSKINYIHGGSKDRLYKVWDGMKRRCYTKTNKDYKNYGARGIKICKEWKINYSSFKLWALQNGYVKGLTIERINNNGNYEEKNCKFIPHEEQSKNRRKKNEK